MEYLSKYTEDVPIFNKQTSIVAEACLVNVIGRHGVSSELHFDQGRHFEPEIWKREMTLKGMKKTRLAPVHHQSHPHFLSLKINMTGTN